MASRAAANITKPSPCRRPPRTRTPQASRHVRLLGRIENNAFDASDRDDMIRIANWPVKGLYMPDAIAAYRVKDSEEDFGLTLNPSGFFSVPKIPAKRDHLENPPKHWCRREPPLAHRSHFIQIPVPLHFPEMAEHLLAALTLNQLA